MNKKKISQLPLAGALTGTELIETVQGGVNKKTTTQDIADLGDGSSNYKVYVALLTQTGINAPVATVIKNTLGGTVVWSRVSGGNYEGTLIGAFPDGKTATFITNGQSLSTGDIHLYRFSDDVVNLSTASDGQTGSDGSIVKASVKIEVYP